MSSLTFEMKGVGVDDPTEFLLDASLFRDELPQPYRLIDKILTSIIDNAWEILASLHQQREKEALRFRAPQYECNQCLEDHKSVNCLAVCPDNRYLIIGQSNGVTVIEAITNQIKSMWIDTAANIVRLNVTSFSASSFMIAASNRCGVVWLLLFTNQSLFVMCTLNTSMQYAGETNQMAAACSCSSYSDYVGMYTADKADESGWLEIHRIPKDIWIKELEDITGAVPPLQSAAAPDFEQFEKSTQSSFVNGSVNIATKHDFSVPTLIVKAKPVDQRVKGCTYSSPAAALKATSGLGEFLPGSAVCHILTTNHINARRTMFEQLHEAQLQFLPKRSDSSDDEGIQIPNAETLPTFHFMISGNLSIQPPVITGGGCGALSSSVAIWWSNQRHLEMYLLTKPPPPPIKGGGVVPIDSKPTAAWSFASPPVASALSACSSILALGLANNTVVLWDKQFGSFNYCRIDDEGKISDLLFLDKTAGRRVSLLALLTTGRMYLVLTGGTGDTSITVISDDAWSESGVVTAVQTIPGLNYLVVTCRKDRRLFIQDTMSKMPLFEIVFPDDLLLQDRPTLYTCVTAANGNFLYCIAQRDSYLPIKAEQDDGLEERNKFVHAMQGSLFVFDMKASYASLDNYRNMTTKEECAVDDMCQNTLEIIVNKALRERIESAAERKERLQHGWLHMQDHVQRPPRLIPSS